MCAFHWEVCGNRRVEYAELTWNKLYWALWELEGHHSSLLEEKKGKTKMYVKVEFHDNDFGNPVRNGLDRLWNYVYENNSHAFQDTFTILDAFKWLHKEGHLKRLLDMLVDIEYIACNVEFCTRGLYHTNPQIREQDIPESTESITKSYLTLDISIIEDNEYDANKWENGEVAYLNIETGDITLL